MGLDEVDDKRVRLQRRARRRRAADNADTIRNIRLWDPAVMQASFERNAGLRSRLLRDQRRRRRPLRASTARPTQVIVAARDLRRDGMPQPSWVARHLTYTHGYGVVLSPANAKERTGSRCSPSRTSRSRTSGGAPEITQPEIYFGEDQSGYVIVNTGAKEIDLPDDDGTTKFTNYAGKDGIEARTRLRPEGGVRPPLRRHQPADLQQPQARLASCSSSATSGTGSRRPRRSSSSTTTRTRSIVDGRIVYVDRRLHDHRPLPERAAGRHRRTSPTDSGLRAGGSTTCATR